LLENTVVNWTLIDRKMRTSVRIGVSYGSPVEQVAKLIKQAVDDQAVALNDPAPVVFLEDFGDSALIFETFFCINATADRELRKIRSDIRFRIDTLFRENNIVIAFPQRDVHVDGVIQIANDKPL
jgi:small-conductance mechanosensitive channel